MNTALETINFKNKIIEIHQDNYPQNPRENDNADIIICFHKRYTLGDKHNYKINDFSGWDELEKQLIKDYQPIAIKPIYMYDHSGVTISTTPFSCPWDSGQIGFILISRETALKENYSKRIDKKIKTWAEKYIQASIKEYDQYLTGDVYGYIIKDENEEEINACWGFYGLNYTIKQAKEFIA